MDEHNAVAIKFDKDLLVIQANELIRSKQDDMTLIEAKLIRLAISQVLRDDTDLKTYSCNVMALAEHLGIDNHNIYRDIKKLSKSLLSRSIFIADKAKPNRNGKENYKIFHWVDYVEYRDGVITFKLSDSLKPYLLGLDELFTLYGSDIACSLPSNYSIRLYELMASYQNMVLRPHPDTNYANVPIEPNEFIFTVEWLKDRLDCNDKYKLTADFIKRVIDTSVRAINKYTFMRLSYRTVKTGRSIKYIVFKIHDWDDTSFDDRWWKLKALVEENVGSRESQPENNGQ